MSIHSSVFGHLDCSHLWLLGIMRLSTWVYKYLSKPLLSFILIMYPKVEFLGHMASLSLIFWRICIPFLLWKFLNIHESWKKRAVSTSIFTSRIQKIVLNCLILECQLIREIHTVWDWEWCIIIAQFWPLAFQLISDTNFWYLFPREKLYNSVLLMEQGTLIDPQSKFNKS